MLEQLHFQADESDVMIDRALPFQAHLATMNLLPPSLQPLIMTLAMFTVSATAATYQNVSLGSILSTSSQTTSWLSPSGDFAFGFLPFQGGFLLGIWFDKTPDKTVVWSAKTTLPLPEGSTLELNIDGKLVLNDSNGKDVWIANSNAATVAYGAMLDSGNFVLVESPSNSYAWQSFENPTDTILPTQELNLGSNLVSHLMYTDFSDGNFKLAVDVEGDLALHLINGPNGYDYDHYWSRGTTGNGSRLVFDNSGNVFMATKDNSYVSVTSCSADKGAIYQRATLDPDGVFRHYYMTNGMNGDARWQGWFVASQVPLNICTALTTDKGGAGACGFNAYCTLDNEGNPNCQCPQRYSFLDPARKYKGCKPDFPFPICGDNGSTVDGTTYELIRIINTDWPFSDYEIYKPVDEETCATECLSDCFCAVAIFKDGQCWKKKLPLSNGRFESSVGGKAFLKVSRENVTQRNVTEHQGMADKKSWKLSIVTTSLLIGGLSFLNVMSILFLLFCCYGRRFKQKEQRQDQSNESTLGSSVRLFSFKELEESTEGFRHKLGEGASGAVYKGTFSEITIAVKWLLNLDKGVEKEFTNEVRAIGQAHHKNLVKLLGFCNEGPHRLLVYEFMSNGSLASAISGGPRLEWTQRVHIAHGIARGLLYLHDECDNQIIHCDIKPENVLLDEFLSPRICDFGVVKLLKMHQSRTKTAVRGTIGYLAPEWLKGMPVTVKVDVYSFGVMLLEIICFRRNILNQISDDDELTLMMWAYDCYKARRLDMLVGEDEADITTDIICNRFAMVALWCIQEDPTRRPSMKKVMQMLEGVIPIPLPIPDPFVIQVIQPSGHSDLEPLDHGIVN